MLVGVEGFEIGECDGSHRTDKDVVVRFVANSLIDRAYVIAATTIDASESIAEERVSKEVCALVIDDKEVVVAVGGGFEENHVLTGASRAVGDYLLEYLGKTAVVAEGVNGSEKDVGGGVGEFGECIVALVEKEQGTGVGEHHIDSKELNVCVIGEFNFFVVEEVFYTQFTKNG